MASSLRIRGVVAVWFGVQAILLWTGGPPLLAGDCDFTGRDDSVEVEAGESPDCDGNGVPDSCDVMAPAKVPAGPFLAPARFEPLATAIADFDGDGLEELAVLVEHGQGFYVYRKETGQRWLPGALRGVGGVGSSFVARDLDQDGDPDVIVALPAGSSVALIENSGAGAFQPPRKVEAFSCPSYADAGDLDQDGIVDLVALGSGTGDVALLRVLWGDRSGDFERTWISSDARGPRHAVLADLDGDGDPDLAVANGSSSTVSLFRNDGPRLLRPEVQLPVGAGPCQVIAGDVDGDGWLDLATADEGSGTVSILHNSGQGQFDPARFVSVGISCGALAGGDLDGDGITDIAALDTDLEVIWSLIRLGEDDGTMAKKGPFLCATRLRTLAGGDLDGDGDLDLALSHGESTVGVLLNSGDGSFPTGRRLRVGAVFSHAEGDVDGDGLPDLLTSTETGVVLFQEQDGTFDAVPAFPDARNARTVALADLDGDGRSDPIRCDYGPPGQPHDSIQVAYSRAGRTFTAATEIRVGAGPGAIVARDLDGDGSPDIVLTVQSPSSLAVVFNGGAGALSPVMNVPLDMAPASLDVGDVDGDGLQEIVCGGARGQVRLLRVVGRDVATGTSPDLGLGPDEIVTAVALGDVEPDGDLDLAVCSFERLRLFENQGGGVFARRAETAMGFALACELADLDLDGDLDLLAVDDVKGLTIGVHLGEWRIQLAPGVGFRYPSDISVADLDLDGLPELVLSEGSMESVTIVPVVPYTADDADCNRNGLPDSCDIADGSFPDHDGDGTPDICQEPVRFHRGDVDDDGFETVGDAIRILGYLFLDLAEPACRNAADSNDDGTIDMSDAVGILGYLFLGSAPPADPGPPGFECGADPGAGTAADLGCGQYTSC